MAGTGSQNGKADFRATAMQPDLLGRPILSRAARSTHARSQTPREYVCSPEHGARPGQRSYILNRIGGAGRSETAILWQIVNASFGIRLDVSGLKYWQSALSRYGAPPLIGICDHHAKSALA